MTIKEITREKAREEILQLFKKGDTLYYSDIVKKLDIDLEMVVDICAELQEQKVIEIDAELSE
jgi:Mn-dependent DtxR family transcriptional regulator